MNLSNLKFLLEFLTRFIASIILTVESTELILASSLFRFETFASGKGQSLFTYVSYLKSEFPNLKYIIRKKDKSKPSRGTLSIQKAKKL